MMVIIAVAEGEVDTIDGTDPSVAVAVIFPGVVTDGSNPRVDCSYFQSLQYC